MTSTLIDLDAVVGPPLKVKLKGTTYTLPSDMPVELWLAINATQEMADSTAEEVEAQVREMHRLMLELFREHQPDLEGLPIGMRQLAVAIGVIYSPNQDSGKAQPKATRKPARRGSTTSRARKR